MHKTNDIRLTARFQSEVASNFALFLQERIHRIKQTFLPPNQLHPQLLFRNGRIDPGNGAWIARCTDEGGETRFELGALFCDEFDRLYIALSQRKQKKRDKRTS